MGDFIGVALTAARECDMRRITVACMPGKLCKYAAGLDNTHARRADQDLALLRREAEAALAATSPPTRSPSGRPEGGQSEGGRPGGALSPDEADGPDRAGGANRTDEAGLPEGFAACASVREALPLLPADARAELLRRLAQAALRAFAARPAKPGDERPGETRIDTAPPRLRLLVFDVDGHLLLDVDDGNA